MKTLRLLILFSLLSLFVIFSITTATATEIDVPAGADAISTALAGAAEGDTLVLSTDGGVYTESATVVVDKAVTIKVAQGLTTMPVWSTSGSNHITLLSDLVLEGILFEGVLFPDTAASAIVNGAATPNNLTVDDCEFRNFGDKTIASADAGGTVSSFDSVVVNNSLFHNSGAGIVLDGEHPQGAGQHADNVPGAYYLTVENSTFYNLTGEGVKLEAYVPPGDPGVAVVNYVTINNCGAEGVYVKEVGPASMVTNSVITNCDVGVKIKYLASFEVTYCDVWGNGTDYDGGAFAGAGCFSHDPWFAEPDTGDFRYAWSQLTRASSNKDNIGDKDRWGRFTGGPPRLAVNTIGPGTITVDPVKETYDLGEVVTVTATPEAGAELIGWLGDTLDASGQVVMEAHRYITAQFAPVGAEIVDVNGTFSANVDWSVVAMEFKASSVVTFEEVQHGEVLLGAGAPDTLTVTTDSALTLVDNDLYLAVISTKSFSHGHPHNTQQIDDVSGLGLTWERVATQRGARNQTVLNIYKAQGSPSGDGIVSATLHNFPAGFCIALSVVRYSGVDATDPIVNVVSHNTIGFNGPAVEITGYPRPDKRNIPNAKPDNDAYSVMLPVTDASSPVVAFIAHRNMTHTQGEGFAERDEFSVLADGNTNSISVVDWNVTAETAVEAGTDVISAAVAAAGTKDVLVLVTDGGVYQETGTVVIDKPLTIKAAKSLAEKPTWSCDADSHMIELRDDLTLQGITLDGAQGAALTPVAIRIADGGVSKTGYNLKIDDCDFLNLVNTANDDGHAIYAAETSRGDSVIITNSLFAHIYDKAIKYDKGSDVGYNQVNYFMAENCTFWDLGLGQDDAYAIYVESPGVDAVPQIEFIVNHITIYDCPGGKAIYPKYIDGAVIKNSVVEKGKYAARIYGQNSVVQNFLYHDCSSGISLKEGATEAQLTNILADVDPWFANPDSGDFRYAWSQLTRFATDKKQIGDLRWGKFTGGPPRLAVNTIGPGTITVNPDKEFYDLGEVVTVTATPDADAELIAMYGDTLDANGQVVMDAHRYVTAQFAPIGAEVVDVNGSFGGVVDWSVVALELNGTNVTFDEVQNGGILLGAGAPDTLTVTTDTALALVDNDLYLAVISTKGFSHGHPHNTQVVDSVWGLGLDWEHVATQRGARNATVLNIYKAQGSPSGDGMVSATLHNFPAGFCIALSVVRYSGVDAADPFGNIVSHNTVGFNGPLVEITGYPRPDKRSIPNAKPDADTYSVKLPLKGSGSPVVAFIAHRNLTHTQGEGFAERDEFRVLADGNTNSISVVDRGIQIGVASAKDHLPTTFGLSKNYPNPFNPETVIKYQLPKSCEVKLIIYNMMGQKVATLYDGHQEAGYHSVNWNGLDDQGIAISSGLYFYRLDADSFSKTYKMMLVR